ncbi:MAG: hypothetical protein MJ016_01880 [Victivallaceae bacterium]|nr:hypothetical protein [Victivallaceae bacterium]
MTDCPDFLAEMQSLADLIIPDLPDDWEKTHILFEDYGHGSFGIKSYCLIAEQKTPVPFSDDDIDSIAELFGAIRKKCRVEWKIAHYELSNTLKCKMHFEY